MRITSDKRDGLAILRIAGGLVFDETLPSLRTTVLALQDAGIRRFIMDVSEVTHCDSSGCSEIIRAHITINRHGGVLAFVNPAPRLRLLWSRIKVIQVFHIFDTLEEAEAFVLDSRPDREIPHQAH